MAKQNMIDGGPVDFAWAGAEHILTGYDHLLFLLGALFLLDRFVSILKFATAFTVGHTITLLGATYGELKVDHYLIDALIALTVIAVGALNLARGRRLAPPEALLLSFVFAIGLVHGLGLSTGIQYMTLRGDPGLVGKLLAFNLGVEGGQISALIVMAFIVRLWRASRLWRPLRVLANAGIIVAGVVLRALQVQGFVTEVKPPAQNQQST